MKKPAADVMRLSSSKGGLLIRLILPCYREVRGSSSRVLTLHPKKPLRGAKNSEEEVFSVDWWSDMRLYPRQKRSPSVTIILAFMSIQAVAAAAVQSQDHPSPKKSVTRKKEEEWSSLFQFRGDKRLDKQAE